MFNVDVHKQVMIGCVDFSQFTDENGDNEMYNALEEYLIDYPEKAELFYWTTKIIMYGYVGMR